MYEIGLNSGEPWTEQTLAQRDYLNLGIWRKVREMAEASPLAEEMFGEKGHKDTNYLEVSSSNRFKNTGDEISVGLYPADDYRLGLAVNWVEQRPYPEPGTVMSLHLARKEDVGEGARVGRQYYLNEAGVLSLAAWVEDLEGDALGNYEYKDIGNVGRTILLKEIENFGPIE